MKFQLIYNELILQYGISIGLSLRFHTNFDFGLWFMTVNQLVTIQIELIK